MVNHAVMKSPPAACRQWFSSFVWQGATVHPKFIIFFAEENQ